MKHIIHMRIECIIFVTEFLEKSGTIQTIIMKHTKQILMQN